MMGGKVTPIIFTDSISSTVNGINYSSPLISLDATTGMVKWYIVAPTGEWFLWGNQMAVAVTSEGIVFVNGAQLCSFNALSNGSFIACANFSSTIQSNPYIMPVITANALLYGSADNSGSAFFIFALHLITLTPLSSFSDNTFATQSPVVLSDGSVVFVGPTMTNSYAPQWRIFSPSVSADNVFQPSSNYFAGQLTFVQPPSAFYNNINPITATLRLIGPVVYSITVGIYKVSVVMTAGRLYTGVTTPALLLSPHLEGCNPIRHWRHRLQLHHFPWPLLSLISPLLHRQSPAAPFSTHSSTDIQHLNPIM